LTLNTVFRDLSRSRLWGLQSGRMPTAATTPCHWSCSMQAGWCGCTRLVMNNWMHLPRRPWISMVSFCELFSRRSGRPRKYGTLTEFWACRASPYGHELHDASPGRLRCSQLSPSAVAISAFVVFYDVPHLSTVILDLPKTSSRSGSRMRPWPGLSDLLTQTECFARCDGSYQFHHPHSSRNVSSLREIRVLLWRVVLHVRITVWE
jgi:hypothetical protein